MSRPPGLTELLRQTLGCGCPPEVLAQIEDSQLPGPLPLRRIAVGGRLLVYLIAAPETGLSPQGLADSLAQGRRERDALGFHRFRLVIATDHGRDPGWTGVFERLAAGDERMHLHLVPTAAVPAPAGTQGLELAIGGQTPGLAGAPDSAIHR